MSRPLTAYCTFIRPTTLSARARSRVCFSRRTMIEEASEWAGSEQALSPE